MKTFIEEIFNDNYIFKIFNINTNDEYRLIENHKK